MKKLVSIITFCFNGESFVGRYLDSVLSQTYPNIELILVNDGSHDNTEKIVLSYKQKFIERGFDFIYKFQQNAGQATALNTGLKIFKGDYLTWPDSDDFLDSQSIEKKVVFLEDNIQYGFVRSDAYVYNEKNLNNPTVYISGKKDNRFSDKILNDLILEKTFCSSGCYMVRSNIFLDVNPQKQIYSSDKSTSQNFQMLLPLAHKFKCGYIDEPLYNIVVRQKSYSHSFISKEDMLKRCDGHEDILKNTFYSMDIDKDYYNKIVSEKYLYRKMNIASKFRDKELAEECYAKLKDMGRVTNRVRLYYFMSRNILIYVAIKGLSKIRRVIMGKFK